jgi:hypothetical protein
MLELIVILLVGFGLVIGLDQWLTKRDQKWIEKHWAGKIGGSNQKPEEW